MPQGQCTLPPDDTGRILDRLAGLEQVISPEAVRQALEVTGRINQRTCKLTHEVICWVVLAMGILTELPIRQVFKHARRLRVGEETPHRSSLCVARQRLGIAPVRHVFASIVHPLAGFDLGLMLLRHPFTSLLMQQLGIHNGQSYSRTATNAPSCTSGTARSTPPPPPVPSTSSPSHTTDVSPEPCTPPPSRPNRWVSSPPPRSHSPSGPSCSGCRSS